MAQTTIRSSKQLFIDADLQLGAKKIHGLTPGTLAGDAVEFNQLNTAIANAISGVGGAIHVPVADLAAAKAVVAAGRSDKMIMLIETLGLYRFDAQAMDVSNDATIIRPTDVASDAAAGRWLKMSSTLTDHSLLSNVLGNGQYHLSLTERDKLTGIATNANNYTHPNHSGHVVSTGDGATTIQANVVTVAMMASAAVSSTATINTLALRDGSGNIGFNNLRNGYTTTATAAGTTTFVVGSTFLQFFTGSAAQTITLPVTNTLVLGHQFRVYNNSTGVITVNATAAANGVVTLAPNTEAIFTCKELTATPTAASWDVKYIASNVSSGKVMTINNSIIFAATDDTRTLNIGTGGTLNTGAFADRAVAAITSGTITGITDLAVADGGTGVSSLSGIAFGNGTAAFSVASAAQIVAAIGATTVQKATTAAAVANALTAGTGITSSGTFTGAAARTFSFDSTWGDTRYRNRSYRATPVGTVNGTNAAFTIAALILSGTEEVFINGVLMNGGAGNDYTIAYAATSTITFIGTAIPSAGDVILVNYSV